MSPEASEREYPLHPNYEHLDVRVTWSLTPDYPSETPEDLKPFFQCFSPNMTDVLQHPLSEYVTQDEFTAFLDMLQDYRDSKTQIEQSVQSYLSSFETAEQKRSHMSALTTESPYVGRMLAIETKLRHLNPEKKDKLLWWGRSNNPVRTAALENHEAMMAAQSASREAYLADQSDKVANNVVVALAEKRESRRA